MRRAVGILGMAAAVFALGLAGRAAEKSPPAASAKPAATAKPAASARPAAAPKATKPPPAARGAELKALSGAELVKEYEAAGLGLQDTYHIPVDAPISRPVKPGGPTRGRFQAARREIIARGAAIVPELLDFLRAEVPKRRPAGQPGGLAPAFTADVIELLAAIRDPRAAEVLVEILDGFQGQANAHQQHAALDGLEHLTCCAFRKVEPHHDNYADAVEHPTAVVDGQPFRDKAAARYRDWFKGEGKEPKDWLPLARGRAHRLLASDDLPAVYCAATFLRPYKDHWSRLEETGRDDQPEKTLARLAGILAESRKTGEGYVWRGRAVPVTIYNWVQMVAWYGPLARPYAKMLIRLQEESGLENWGGFEDLLHVGGEEIMAFFFRALPQLKDGDGFHSLWRCRTNIDRWAGRAFASDEERLKWWEANRKKSQEAWLREGLPVAAAQTDRGDQRARGIFLALLPDLRPSGVGDEPLFPGTARRGDVQSAVEWLKAHQEKLRYDPQLGGFRLGAEPASPGKGK